MSNPSDQGGRRARIADLDWERLEQVTALNREDAVVKVPWNLWDALLAAVSGEDTPGEHDDREAIQPGDYRYYRPQASPDSGAVELQLEAAKIVATHPETGVTLDFIASPVARSLILAAEARGAAQGTQEIEPQREDWWRRQWEGMRERAEAAERALATLKGEK